MSNLPTSFNPSDYESLIKTLTQGNTISKAQSLKRLITLVVSDKKQFSIYAKRIVLAIQDLMFQQKDNVNLLIITLVLEIINLNPREIQYYIRSRLLNNMVKNLGDSAAQVRKKSHYCLLAYVKTYKSFEDIIQVYLSTGINSDQWQLRQKSINSFQSILIMEMKYLNWSSSQFKKLFEILLTRLKDESAYVQKASQQCLISLIKLQQLRVFSKTLSPQNFNVLKHFCQAQFEAGNIIQINIEIQQKKLPYYHKNKIPQNQSHHKQLERVSQNNTRGDNESPQKRAILNRIQEIRKRSIQTPKKLAIQNQQKVSLKKAQSVIMVNHAKQMKKNSSTQVIVEKPKNQIKLQPIKKPRKESAEEDIIQPNFVSKQEKVQNILGRKLIQDLKNDKDWKVRLDAVQELQARFEIYKQTFDIQAMTKTFLPVLVKLLNDMNFKVALISLKLIEQIMHIPKISLEGIVPQLMQKLSDNKIALRQSISRLIKIQYSRKKEDIWIDHLLLQIKKASNSNIKEQILGILARLYEQKICLSYNAIKVVQAVCPLMDDLKTKIKIKTLDLLVLITTKTQNQDEIKDILMSKLNQVYYQMYLEKLNKQLKNNQKQNSISILSNSNQSTPNNRGLSRNTSIGNRRYSKISGNSTSTSLQRDKNNPVIQPNSTARTSSFLQRPDKKQVSRRSEESQNNNTQSKISLHDPQSDSDKKKSILKSFRKKTHKPFDYKSTNYSSSQELQPFSDPDKQLKNILTQIKSEDWQVCFQALNKTKRIIQHHRELLSQSVIKQLTPDLMRLVQNLRSSLSKNAVLTLNDLSNKVKRHLDTQLDLIFNKLIKKTLDANSFISEEVKKVLVSICSNCNQSRVISLLTASHTTRAIPIKQVIAHILQNITFLPKVYQKQLQRVVMILNDFMSEGSLQIREKTKALLNQIIASQKGKSVLRLISSQHLAKLKKPVEQKIPELKIVQAVNSEIKNPVQHQEMASPQHKKKKKQKIQVFPEQFNALQGLLQKCQSSDWKVRSESMTQIYQICSKYPQQASQHRLNSKFIDVLSKQIGDPNIKVATNALKIFKQLTSLIPILIENNLSVILNEVFNCFASQKNQVKTLSQEIFDQIAANVQQWMLLQHMCNGVLYGVQKSKGTIIQKLIGLVANTCKIKPSIFQKNVFPMINKTVQQGKPDLLPSLKLLINQCYNQIGDSCIDYLKPKSKQMLN